MEFGMAPDLGRVEGPVDSTVGTVDGPVRDGGEL